MLQGLFIFIQNTYQNNRFINYARRMNPSADPRGRKLRPRTGYTNCFVHLEIHGEFQVNYLLLS